MLVSLFSGKNFSLLILSLSILACSSNPYKGDYDAESENNRELDVPPDLVLPKGDDSLKIPSIAAEQTSLSSYQNRGIAGDSLVADVQGVRMQRDGAVRWLEFDAAAERVWPKLSLFFKSLGFEIIHEDKKVGLVETGWQENRVELSDNWFAVIFNSFSSSGLKDRYRARLERDGDKTLLFITHQGLREKHIDDGNSDADDTFWEYRNSDPDLEKEMLMRFLVFKGMKKDTAVAIVGEERASRAEMVTEDDKPYLHVTETFPRTWRRVGLAMDRLGVHVEDRNRSAGVYYFSLSKEFRDKQDKGWFESLFGSDAMADTNEFILKLDRQDEIVKISVRSRDGQPVPVKLAELVLTELQTYLK
ncbi:hypothetical protein MNBD_GAMMA25-1251 [hydrothermal vent metagenome]|uniref:Outer membrane protein assembly factor BamC n=1 Tax=hydrothermal vent metagenome TaxID=652676 RepID=A0A3B1BYQ5_9ZZZZ